MPSRDAGDDRFQRTLDVLSGTTMEQLTSWVKELSNDMLNSMYGSMINHIAEAFFTWCYLRYALFPSNLRTHLKNRHRWADECELTFARLAEACDSSDFAAQGGVRSHFVFYTNNIWRAVIDDGSDIWIIDGRWYAFSPISHRRMIVETSGFHTNDQRLCRI